MASLLSPRPDRVLARQPADAWPVAPLDRWLLRLLFALPFVVVALLSRGTAWPADGDDALARRGSLVRWGDTGLEWVAEVFPPLSAGLASVLRGNGLAFNLVAAAVVGFTLQRLTGVLVREGFGRWATPAVMATLVLTPPLYYLAANGLEQLLGLALVILALDGIALFVENGSTEAGFRAGLALGVAVMVDPGAWLYALTLAAVAPFFARHTSPREPAANLATVAVLLFPAVAAVSFWLYVSWWFGTETFGGIGAAPVAGWFPGGVEGSAARAAALIGQGLIASPLFLIAFAFRVARDRWTLVAPGIALVGLYASLWLGLREAAGQTYLVLTALYILLLAVRRPSPARKVVIVVAALAQVGIVWALVLTTDGTLGAWVRAVAAG